MMGIGSNKIYAPLELPSFVLNLLLLSFPFAYKCVETFHFPTKYRIVVSLEASRYFAVDVYFLVGGMSSRHDCLPLYNDNK